MNFLSIDAGKEKVEISMTISDWRRYRIRVVEIYFPILSQSPISALCFIHRNEFGIRYALTS